MNLGIWKIFVSLGVPGLALGIFYMLFRKFKFKFPAVPKKWVGPIIILFMIITGALVFYTLSLWAPNRVERTGDKIGGKVSINYARIFGAHVAPMVLIGESKNYSNNIRIFWTYKKVIKFWEKWEYRDALPLKSITWDQLWNRETDYSLDIHLFLLELSCQGDENSKEFFVFLNDKNRLKKIEKYLRSINAYEKERLESLFSLEDELSLYLKAIGSQTNAADLIKQVEKCGRNVGYLVLFLRNNTNKIIYDMELSFKEYVKENLDTPFVSPEKLEEHLAQTKEIKKILPTLEPKQNLSWLLAIYLKDENGYPSAYISSVTRPLEMKYHLSDSDDWIEIEIRKPYKEKAIKVNLPFGWYHQ